MKYSPSARDGVFVVEVQQGVRRSPGSGGAVTKDAETSVAISNQCALVHNPPDRLVGNERKETGTIDSASTFVILYVIKIPELCFKRDKLQNKLFLMVQLFELIKYLFRIFL